MFEGRLGIQQRVLASYRVPFFDAVARRCTGGLSVFSGRPLPAESLLTGKLSVAETSSAINLHLFGGAAYICLQRGMLDWLQEWQPDVLVMEANPRILSIPAAARWMRRHVRPVIGWGKGMATGDGVLGIYRRRFLGQFDLLVAYSTRAAREYESLGVPPGRIRLVRNATADAIDAPCGVRHEFSRRVLFVGRLHPRKRVDWLIRACAEVDPRPKLTIVGEGSERSFLRTLANRLLPDAEFTGMLAGEALRRQFEAADIFVLPGASGLALQEAMSSGVPVIVASGDGTREDLVSPSTGWALPDDSYEVLVKTLREALSDPVRLRAMGAAGRKVIEEQAGLSQMVDSFVQSVSFSQSVPLRRPGNDRRDRLSKRAR